ncbi:MAG: thiazole synthase [Candidatus Hydrogenedentota bacterium]|nr:MAG: thiazole synthase [Candidatus Hydrogenedentota bacterium]
MSLRYDPVQRKTDGPLVVGETAYRSRLIVGTGKYADLEVMRRALEASEAEVVTVALRRVDLDRPDKKTLLDFIPKSFRLLPNTAGCYTAEEAVRVARLSREMGIGNAVKLEVLGDERTLLPDVVETLKAAETLVEEGFEVWAYTNDDPVTARKLQEIGVAAVMPLGAPIGSGQGLLNPNPIRIILEEIRVPVIVDAGVGTASDVVLAMELGIDGVLLNTGIAGADDPVRMARAMAHAVRAGREAFLAGRIPKRLYAKASTPEKDF